jgi:hypothetical protein
MAHPKWVTPARQAELVELFVKSQGFCVYVNKPCQGEWERRSLVACAWGNIAIVPFPMVSRAVLNLNRESLNYPVMQSV